jgi:hypothetical protein
MPYSFENQERPWFKKHYTLGQLIDSKLPELSDVHAFSELVAKRQFIGLCDKNGVEIYEGDICVWYINNLERLGEVYYHDQSFEMRSPSLGYIGWDANRGEIKVIGNVYQNPELLK